MTFAAPKPYEGEMHHAYLLRVVAAFEEWANTPDPVRIARDLRLVHKAVLASFCVDLESMQVANQCILAAEKLEEMASADDGALAKLGRLLK